MQDLSELAAVIADRKANPQDSSYTCKLLADPELACRKLNEETYEVIHAALTADNDQIRYEAADLLYHLLVLLARHGIAWDDVLAELSRRR